jgi:hypothetical protein
MGSKRNPERTVKRYGAAEIFGHALVSLQPIELQRLTKSNRGIKCPFKSNDVLCCPGSAGIGQLPFRASEYGLYGAQI